MRAARLILIAVLALASATAAQTSVLTQSGFFRGFSPAFSPRELKMISRVLRLNPDAQHAMEALYSAYIQTLRVEGDAAKAFAHDLIERAEIMNNQSLLPPAQKRLGEFRERAEQLRTQFLDDLRSLLTREQESLWPLVEREIRRQRLLRDGQLTGEKIDAAALTEEVLRDAPMPTAVSELLDRYRQEIDRALQAREAFLEAERDRFGSLIDEDPKRAASIWAESRLKRGLVRDTNERFVRQIAAELPPELGLELERKAMEQSFPMLVRTTKVEEYLQDALDLPSLTREQRLQLQELNDRHERQRAQWLKSAGQVWREQEAAFKPRALAVALGELPPEAGSSPRAALPDDHPLQELRRKRYELDRATRQTIDGILTPDQRDEVPSRYSDSARFEDWGFGGL